MSETIQPLTTKQAARLLSVSLSTVNRLILAGELRATKKTATDRNSPYLVDLSSVLAYIARRRAV